MSFRTSLAAALGFGLLLAAPFAYAQGGDDPTEDDSEGIEGIGDTDEGGDQPATDAVQDEPPSDPGGWGVGGEEVEGRYKPRGKTGKLKELEDDEAEDREEATGPVDLPPAGFAVLDFAAGFGDLAVPARLANTTDVDPTASFLISAGYRVDDIWQITLRFPVSSGFNNGPSQPYKFDEENECFTDNDCYRQIAVGALELGVKPAFILSRSMRLPIGLAFALPTAEGDFNANVDNRADRGKAVVNLAAAASRGWEDRALFAHKRFGITPSTGLWYRKDIGPGKLDAAVDTKVEIMIKTHGADPLPAEQLATTEASNETRDVAVNWVLGLSGFYDLLDGLVSPGVRMWIAVGSAADVKGSQDYGGAQFVLEPNVRTMLPFTEAKSFGMVGRIGYMIPGGGPLGGEFNAELGGLRITAGMFF